MLSGIAMKLLKVKTVRFAEVVEKCGAPQSYTLWQKPRADKQLQTLRKNHRVMTIQQTDSGTDFGVTIFRSARCALSGVSEIAQALCQHARGRNQLGPGQIMSLTSDERLRYSRHLTMPEVTLAGQERLKAARILCIGAGGLGSPSAMYLAAAGVGTIALVDADRVELSNLQRQLLYGTKDVGRGKVEARAGADSRHQSKRRRASTRSSVHERKRDGDRRRL